MNDPKAEFPSFATQGSGSGPQPEEPQFGALDIVEAFTAMRHEWRGQTKETRALAEQVQAAVATLEALASRESFADDDTDADTDDDATEDGPTDPSSDAPEVRPLIQSLVDADLQLTRAIIATTQWEEHRRSREAADAAAAEQFFAQMNSLARWFARPLWDFVTKQRAAREQFSAQPVLEGLHLVLGRVRRAMGEHQLERIDTLGQPFDAETMHAIASVAGSAYPAGHVAEQLSPLYLWRGELLRYAEVRVATVAKTQPSPAAIPNS